MQQDSSDSLLLLDNPDRATEAVGRSIALSDRFVVLGAPAKLRDGSQRARGQVYYAPRTQDLAPGDFKLLNPGGGQGDYFGYSVALSGRTLVVGAPRVERENKTGAVYVFEYQDEAAPEWKQTAIIHSPSEHSSPEFGASVAIENNTVVIGDPGESRDGIDAGAVFVANLRGSSTEPTRIAHQATANDRFGTSVAISGGIIAIGSPREDCHNIYDSGAVYLYSWGSANQAATQLSRLCLPPGGCQPGGTAPREAFFGHSIDLEGQTLLVGAPNYDYYDTQRAKILPNVGSGFIYNTAAIGTGRFAAHPLLGARPFCGVSLGAGDLLTGEQLGTSVSLWGDVAALSSFDDLDYDLSGGAVRLFRKDRLGRWDFAAKIVSPRGEGLPQSQGFGAAVALGSDRTLVVGTPYFRWGLRASGQDSRVPGNAYLLALHFAPLTNGVGALLLIFGLGFVFYGRSRWSG